MKMEVCRLDVFKLSGKGTNLPLSIHNQEQSNSHLPSLFFELLFFICLKKIAFVSLHLRCKFITKNETYLPNVYRHLCASCLQQVCAYFQ